MGSETPIWLVRAVENEWDIAYFRGREEWPE
jgi:hypothetical protein